MHEWLVGSLHRFDTERNSKLCLLAPRGESKSTMVTLFYVLWCVARKTERYIWIASDVTTLTRKHIARLRAESIDNIPLQEAYPGVFGRYASHNADAISFGNGVKVEGFSTGQNPRGSIIRYMRPTLMILDDPEGQADEISPTRREHNLSWFESDFMKSSEPGTNAIVLGTAICPDCLVLKVKKSWPGQIFKAIIDWPENMLIWYRWRDIYLHALGADDADKLEAMNKAKAFYEANRTEMNAGHKVSWPARYPLYALMCEWADNPVSFQKERQNDPSNPDACEWPGNFFDWEKDGQSFWFSDWPDKITQRIVSLDPSKGQGEESDYSAWTALVRDDRGVWYVETDMARRNVMRICTDGISFIQRFEQETEGLIDGMIIEGNNFQELIGPILYGEAMKQGLDLDGRMKVYTNLIQKDVRIRRLTAPLSRHLLRFRRTAGTRMCVQQMKEFPNGAHIDAADSLEMATRYSIEMWQGKAKKR